MEEWIEDVEKLAAVAGSQPQAAYAAYIHGTKNKWNYICRTTPDCSHLLQPLEDAIHQKLLPAISGRPPCSSTERELLSLPTKLGGIHFSNPTVIVTSEFEASMEVTTPLVNLIIDQSMSFENDPTLANPIISAVKKRKAEEQKVEAERIWNELEPTGRRLMECAVEPGASAWLNALPIDEHGFCLSKGAFRDALSLRYRWPIPKVTSK